MFTKQIWLGAVAMALMTTAASALPIPMYKVVLLPGPSTAMTLSQSAGTAAIGGQQGGTLVVGRFSFACDPLPNPMLCTGPRTHALLWNQSGPRPVIDLNPPAYFSSTLTGMTADSQVGYGYPQTPAYRQQVHALAWFGSAASMIDLNPPRYLGSMANGIDGFQIVGSAYARSLSVTSRQAVRPHAFMWVGLSRSSERPQIFIDLNPKGYAASEAFAVANGYQAGYAFKNAASRHAYLWHGTAMSGHDINPSGYFDSYIVGLNGTQAVGAVTESKNGGAHAYVWNLRSTAFGIDLHGSGFTETVAAAVAGGKQVGWGELVSGLHNVVSYHALVWSGTAKSCIDLHAFLPVNFVSSKAVAIAPDGSIVGIAIDRHNLSHAILWVPQR